MCVELDDASEVHGKDGLGGVVIPESPAEKETMHAWDAIYEAAKKRRWQTTDCCGWSTNKYRKRNYLSS